MKKEIKNLIAKLLREGWTLKHGKHLKVFHPSGKGFVSMAYTPSCNRAFKNIEADVRRLENRLKGEK